MKFKTCLILVGVTLVTACGISGPLEKAPPLWGADRVAYETEQAKLEAERKAKADARAAQNPPTTATPAPKN